MRTSPKTASSLKNHPAVASTGKGGGKYGPRIKNAKAFEAIYKKYGDVKKAAQISNSLGGGSKGKPGKTGKNKPKAKS